MFESSNVFAFKRSPQLFLIQLQQAEAQSFQSFSENKKRFMKKPSNADRLLTPASAFLLVPVEILAYMSVRLNKMIQNLQFF
ncbi:hypothetical protein AS030_16475 [Fictibacillus enclensis]|uniref:Uncharacterized protein n=1 Tax=Fictibacillus enclensis TaxID=1017270 RepID=A0A0V8J4L7_9BACL|nr:hypothetical protein AS030_16475 [Fictibacillus enclensis]